MQRSPRVLRASAVATVLAGLLALATPVTSLVSAVPDGGRPGAAVANGSSRTRAGMGLPTVPAPSAVSVAGSPEASRPGAPAAAPSADPAPVAPRAARARPEVLVHVPEGGVVARAAPRSSARKIDRVVDRSRYYGVPLVAWVEETSADGRWGRVELPYVWPRRDGWIRIDRLPQDGTRVVVRVDLSAHRLTVRRRGEVLFRAPVATGRESSPTPPGEYFVTDRVPFSPGSSFGSFAFGISGIQPRLPAGWSSGDQLAIHGTNVPSSIGTSASAGCIRVSERTLARLQPLLRLGTPVVIVP